MAEFTEMIPAADLKAQTAPAFLASQSANAPAPTANEEAMLRSLLQEASEKGMELTDTVQVQQSSPIVVPPVQAPVISVPEKFKTPEGTVDEEKLKASSKQLDGAIQEREKSIAEMMADYKAKEKQLHDLGQQKASLQQQAPVVPAINPQQVNPNAPEVAQLHQQILADMQRDPVGTTIMLNQALVQKELAPVLERFRQEEESRQDSVMRDNLARLAESDPRVLRADYYNAINQVLDEDPGMRNLKNPHKAAWNEVKERLRLGEASQLPAQPSSSGPTLGRGAPPSVSTFQNPSSPQSMAQQAGSINPYSAEGKAYEEQLRKATNGLWQ